jgi:hypothetical protein
MKRLKKIPGILFLCCLATVAIQAQETIPAAGGNASGSDGSVAFTAGQVFYNTLPGANGTVAQGVQQPYEITGVTGIKNLSGIELKFSVYPNPTKGLINLTVESPDYKNLRVRIYDITGMLLRDEKIESRETQISIEELSSSIYFLRVIKENSEVKVFKIIKR